MGDVFNSKFSGSCVTIESKRRLLLHRMHSTKQRLARLLKHVLAWWALFHAVIEVVVFGLAALGIGTTGVVRNLIEGYATIFMYPLFLIGCPPFIAFGLLLGFPVLMWGLLYWLTGRAMPTLWRQKPD